MKPVPNVDMANLGRGWGWKLEQAQHFPRVRQVAESRGKVAVLQDAGRRDWYTAWGGWPGHFTAVETWPVGEEFAAAIAITDRLLPEGTPTFPSVIYRPPTLTVGIAGNPELSLEELMESVARVLAQQGLSPLSLTALASELSLKNNAALTDFAEEMSIPFLTYPPETLRKIPLPASGVAPTPCALAAMLAAGFKEPLVTGVPFGEFTLSVARRQWG